MCVCVCIDSLDECLAGKIKSIMIIKVTLPALDQEVLEAGLLEEKRLYQKLFVLPKNPLLTTPEHEVLA